MTEPANGNHLNEDDQLTAAEAGANYAKSRLAAILRQIIWLIPFVAMLNLVQTAIKLGVGTEDWQTIITNASQSVLRFDPEPFTCLATSLILLIYWGYRDGWQRLFRRPFMAGLKKWWNQTTAQWQAEWIAEQTTKIRATVRAEERAKARAEARAELGLPPDGNPQSKPEGQGN